MNRQYGESSLNLSAFEPDFQLRDAEAVLAFIETEPAFLGLLLEAREEIRALFPDAVIFVEVEDDPDTPANPRLMVSIGTTFGAEETLQALKRFDQQWWLKNLDRAKRKITITVELV